MKKLKEFCKNRKWYWGTNMAEYNKPRILYLKRILEEKLYQELLSNYPYQRMDLKHRIVFFLLKYKCILLLKILFKSVKS